ncbi:thioredoxin family protein [Niallia endozanthoxylica]|uniref:Thioredoxin family protein n=1 Tax=Niallia endozanthoxylica TaxID=2036016 RepID=A0A5J5HI92_9BACI|nr:thioredoxin family protein [Niallia endozanthoxylica]KAA9019991.1 thioredoxin family protein [Niallia endozanthoxylica]
MLEWSTEKLETFMHQQGSGLVYLYTPLCGTCQVAGKMLAVTEEILPDITIGKINVNYMPQLAVKWEIESVPCLVFLDKGSIADKLYAFQSVPYLVERIKTFF